VAEYLLDTTIFSYMLKQNAKVLARMASLSAADRLAICSIVRGEVLYGLERLPHGKKKQDLGAKVTGLFRALHCEPVPERAADQYARIKRETERKGTRLDENDLWIAATALSLRATLVTTDSDFRRVTQLNIEDWTL
jgi:tRNA(fMet)-specific endonuclease VapC